MPLYPDCLISLPLIDHGAITLTQMSNAGIPLRVIQEISGHRNLEQLQRYLEVTDAQVLGAAASLAMLSPVASNGVELDTDKKLEIDANSPR